MEVEAPPEWKETPFIFYSSPGTLVSLACSKVALICWCYEIHGAYPYEASDLDTDEEAEWFIKRKFSCVDIYETSLPASIVEKIDNYIKILGGELKKWTYDLHEIFNTDTHDVISRCIDHIIVESNGTISYKKTARSLLDKAKLNSYEKYAIACKNCFERDIELIWNSASADPSWRPDYYKGAGGGTYAMIYYWNCRMNRELARGEHELMEYCASEAWTIIEYFLNRMMPETRSFHLFDATWCFSSDTIKYLLPILTPNQLAGFLKRYSTIILGTLTYNEESCNHAIQVWDYLLLNVEFIRTKFFFILQELCKFTEDDVERNDINLSTYIGRRILLRHIWISAPDNLKKSISNSNVLSIFSYVLNSSSSLLFKTYGFNVDFFVELLKELEFQQRNGLWLQFWRKFIIFVAASDLKKIMELCLPKDNEEFIRFKKRMVNYETLKPEFDLFIRAGRCVELGNYLELFCSSEDEERVVRMQIVDSNMSKIFQFDSKTLKIFNGFIDSAFSSASLANKRKEEFFRENIDEVYTLLGRGWVDNVKNITTLFISHNLEYLTEIKQIYFVRCRNDLISGSVINFNIRNWQEFIKWCSSDDDFLKFKNNLPLEDIFETFLAKTIGRFDEMSVFVPLSNFLCWYFGDRESAKKFLSEKVANYYQQKRAFRITRKPYFYPQLRDLATNQMFRFLFNGDTDQMRRECNASMEDDQ